jgi:hypothetical protein
LLANHGKQGLLDSDGQPDALPLAQDDTATTNENTPVLIDVLANDTDPAENTFSVFLPNAATPHGKVEYSGDQILYTPDPYFYGTDTLTYCADDGGSALVTANVTVTVNFVNQPPLANNDAYSWQGNRILFP